MKTIPFKAPAFGYFPREAFTENVKKRMVDLQSNLALFAPRRRGKTTWVLLELQHAAVTWGLEFAYINLWAKRTDPVGVLAKGLEVAAGIVPDDGDSREIYGEASVGIFKVGGKRGKQAYPKVTGNNAERLAAAMAKLSTKGRRVILVIDEFQEVAKADPEGVAVGALRTALEQHGNKVVALFTGSERSTLARMFKDQAGPLLDQATLIHLPELGESFVIDRVAAFESKSRRHLSIKDATAAFEALGKSPMLLNDVLTEMVVHDDLGIDAAVDELISKRGAEDFGAQVDALKSLDRALLRRIAAEEKPYSDLPGLAADAGMTEDLKATTAQAAMKRLEKLRLIEAKIDSKTGWVIPDPLLERWMRRARG